MGLLKIILKQFFYPTRVSELEKQLEECRSQLEASHKLLYTLQPAGTIDIYEMSSILMDKYPNADLHLADKDCPIYKKQDVINFLNLDETNEITYSPNHDCDDFARGLFCKGFPLVWTNLHSLNWVVCEDRKLYFIEPQQDLISENLSSWQGWEVRFFLNI